MNLLDALNYYLGAAFVIGTILRLRNYRAMLALVYQSSGRWPKLRALVQAHRAIFLRWPTILPVASALLLTFGNAWASYAIYSQARVSPGDLWASPFALIAVLVTGGVMLFLDFKAVFVFGRFDRAAVEAVLDRADHWLATWKAPAIRFLTAGLIHPRRIVGILVRQALVEASLNASGRLWVMSIQILSRAAFYLTLWTIWALALR